MKTRKIERKLKLNKETVSNLRSDEMDNARGGTKLVSVFECFTRDISLCMPDCG